MKYLSRFLSWAAIAGAVVVATGCNETTQKDVVAAKNKVAKEERRLEDIKREEAGAIDDKKQEATGDSRPRRDRQPGAGANA